MERIIEDLGLAKRLWEVEREFKTKLSEYKNDNLSLTQVQKFYRKWNGKMYYKENG